MHEFHPTEASDKDDLIGRGVRVATAASVLSMLFAQAPEAGLLENITNPELLKLWPLRDETSGKGIQMLLNSDEHSGVMARDFRRLFGFNGTLINTGSAFHKLTNHEEPCELCLKNSKEVVGLQRYPELPDEHISNILGSCGTLAGKMTAAARTATKDVKIDFAYRLRDLVNGWAMPLGTFIADGLQELAQSQTYKAAGYLLKGFLDETADLAKTALEDD